MMTFLLIALLVGSVIGIWALLERTNELSSSILESESEYRQAIVDFEKLYSGEIYVSNHSDQQWRNKYKYLDDKIQGHTGFFFNEHVKELLNDFRICFCTDEGTRREFNEEFVKKQKNIKKDLFDSLMDYPLDDQQRTAILHDEDNTLVIAGAGTGKTTTIMGKITYILDNNLASEEEILLISFSKTAVGDMRKDLKKIKIGDGVTVKTFNAFGYGIIGEVEGNKPDLLFGGATNADVKAKDLLTKAMYDKNIDKNLRVMVASFFLYYIYPQPDLKSFDTLDEYYSYVKSVKLVTFQGDIVKSFEELKIANFLYLHNIEYVYEHTFDKSIKSTRFTSYKPDFFLSQYNITIEHFGINKDGSVPAFFNSDNGVAATKRYQEKMEYARNVHKEYGRTLIESYSYEERSGDLLGNLKQNLENVGVQMEQRPLDEILHKIMVGKTFSPFIDLVYTFLTLVKSNSVSVESLREMANEQGDKRVITFIEIFVYLFGAYESYLADNNEIDFNDMIIKATKYIESGQFKHPYKYILVDEFQDMSVGRYGILKALRDQNEGSKLFCVGDDWQSIFRFTGSDISITTSFSEYFGHTYHGRLESTHRFNNKILDYSSDFIQKNPAQLKKSLKADSQVDEFYNALDFRTYKGGLGSSPDQEIINLLEEIQDRVKPEQKKKSSVLLLGRYNHNRPDRLSEIKARFSKVLEIEFLTVHKAKGATRDYSILIDVNDGQFGFPSEIVDDPLVQLVLRKGDDFKNSEERRLFYVAITRARNANYIITQEGGESKFVKELQKNESRILQLEAKKECPQCHGELVERQSKHGAFYGCKNYPLCDYTQPQPKVK